MTSFSKADHATKWIPVKNISVVWAEAQRGLNEREAKRIAENFDPDAFGVCTVTLPNGNGIYHCIDGQTRIAAVRMALGEDQAVPCNVLNTTDVKRAADIFSKMNSGRSKPGAIERFKVAVTAGYEMETAINKLITSLGYHVGTGGDDGTLRAVATCCAIYKRHGLDTLRDTLLIIRSTWGRDAEAVDGVILSGYAEFLAEHGMRVDAKRLIARMQKQYTPGRLLGAAKANKEMFRGSSAENVARILLATYNTGIRNGRLGIAEAA